MQIVTLATAATLGQAQVLTRSIRRHQPDWPVDVVIAGGGASAGRALADEGSVRVCPVSGVIPVNIERLVARYEPTDLASLLLPAVLRSYCERTSAPVLHLPPSAWLLSDLEPIEAQIANHSVVLVPRMSADIPDDGLEPSRLQMERAGRIDESVIAVDGRADAIGFLAWWGKHVEETIGAIDGRHMGARPEDRPWLARFLELAPARFSTAVVDDPGFNLSMWNLHERTLGGTADHPEVEGAGAARLMNLPGFEPDRPHRLSAIASRVRVSRSPVLRELCARYAGALKEVGTREVDYRREVGRTLEGGLIYDDSMNALWGEPARSVRSSTTSSAIRAPAPSWSGWKARRRRAAIMGSTVTFSTGWLASDRTSCAPTPISMASMGRSAWPGSGPSGSRSLESRTVSCLHGPRAARRRSVP